MAHAEKCPICNGVGEIEDTTYGNATVKINKTCHGCGGKGWVEVSDSGDITFITN